LLFRRYPRRFDGGRSMAKVFRWFVGNFRGDVTCTFNSGAINHQSVVLVAASEGDRGDSSASPNRHVGSAHIRVENIAPLMAAWCSESLLNGIVPCLYGRTSLWRINFRRHTFVRIDALTLRSALIKGTGHAFAIPATSDAVRVRETYAVETSAKSGGRAGAFLASSASKQGHAGFHIAHFLSTTASSAASKLATLRGPAPKS
jgi:hypothetical protein